MAESLASVAVARHRELAEIRPSTMAKANLRSSEISDERVLVGRVIQRALSLLGWTLDRLARELEMDARQLARWISGAERPHFDRLMAVCEMRQALVVAWAELDPTVAEVETIVRVKVRVQA